MMTEKEYDVVYEQKDTLLVTLRDAIDVNQGFNADGYIISNPAAVAQVLYALEVLAEDWLAKEYGYKGREILAHIRTACEGVMRDKQERTNAYKEAKALRGEVQRVYDMYNELPY